MLILILGLIIPNKVSNVSQENPTWDNLLRATTFILFESFETLANRIFDLFEKSKNSKSKRFIQISKLFEKLKYSVVRIFRWFQGCWNSIIRIPNIKRKTRLFEYRKKKSECQCSIHITALFFSDRGCLTFSSKHYTLIKPAQSFGAFEISRSALWRVFKAVTWPSAGEGSDLGPQGCPRARVYLTSEAAL